MSKNLKAPQIDHYIWWLGQIKYHQYDNAVIYDADSYVLLEELFELLEEVKTNAKGIWKIWLRAERGTVEAFGDYEEMLDMGEVESYEDFVERWRTEYPHDTEWYEFQAVYEKDINYKAIVLGHRFVIELDERKEKGGFEHDISEFAQWLVEAVKEVIADLRAGVYNERIERELPVVHRTGTVLRKYEWEIWPHVKEEILGDLTEKDLAEFLSCAEETVSDKSRLLKQITANDFFRFCAMGYAANRYDGCEKSPREQYKLHADGRHDGLLEIDPDSPEAFETWYYEGTRGGHPWEVCRGGNSTHISLYVHSKGEGWFLSVAGSAWTRCQEAMKFFLALHRAGLPVTMREAPMLKARIKGEEKVGVVPHGVMPAYCHSYFPGEEIIDFTNLPHEVEEQEQMARHCVWQPLERIELRDEASH